MAWQPPDEPAQIDCSVQAREGVRFDLWLGEKSFCYSRVKTFAVSDPLETVVIDRNAISKVTLKKKAPWALRLIGGLLMVGTTAAVIGFIRGDVDRFPFVVLVGYVLGGACLIGTSNRWQLTFLAGRKTHKLVQPVAQDKAKMNAMAQALQQAAQLLASRNVA